MEGGWHQSLMEPKTPISFVSLLRSIKSEQHQLRFWRLLSTLLSLRTGWADHSSKPIRWFQKAIISEWLQSPCKDFAIWRTQTNVEHMAFHGQLHFEKQTNWYIYKYKYIYSFQFQSSFQPHIWDPESFNRIHVIVKTTLPKEDPINLNHCLVHSGACSGPAWTTACKISWGRKQGIWTSSMLSESSTLQGTNS